MGVITIVFFFVMMSVVMVAMSAGAAFGLTEIVAGLVVLMLGGGALVGALNLIEPDRTEEN